MLPALWNQDEGVEPFDCSESRLHLPLSTGRHTLRKLDWPLFCTWHLRGCSWPVGIDFSLTLHCEPHWVYVLFMFCLCSNQHEMLQMSRTTSAIVPWLWPLPEKPILTDAKRFESAKPTLCPRCAKPQSHRTSHRSCSPRLSPRSQRCGSCESCGSRVKLRMSLL